MKLNNYTGVTDERRREGKEERREGKEERRGGAFLLCIG